MTDTFKLTDDEIELNDENFIYFSKDEIDIINKLINVIHNSKNTIVLSESLYNGAFFLIESLRRGFIKELREKQNVDNDILQSFEEKIIKREDFTEKGLKIKNIDKNNLFGFNFIWNNEFEKNNDLLEDYEKIRFSGIGFNKEKTKAIIFMELTLKDEGHGKIYLFEKKNKEWEIINIIDEYGIIKNRKKPNCG